jgi:hypothetical protein
MLIVNTLIVIMQNDIMVNVNMLNVVASSCFTFFLLFSNNSQSHNHTKNVRAPAGQISVSQIHLSYAQINKDATMARQA